MKDSLNEREVIELLLEALGQPKASYSRIGDDVAYMPSKKGLLVAKCDMLVGRTDVPKRMRWWQAARKSMVMCVSDFAAKGVKPQATLISLGLPRGVTKRQVDELAKGFTYARREYGVEVVGGDTNEADDLIIDCCMLGFGEKVVARCGAKPGDIVAVSGCFGYTSAGLKILLKGFEAASSFRRRALKSVLMPKARLDFGVELAKMRAASASIDSSDGLAISLHEIARFSRVGVLIEKLPLSDELTSFAEKNGVEVEELVLYGGEEYEIVATIPEDRLKAAREAARKTSVQLIEIGRVTDRASEVVLSTAEGLRPVEMRGWIHFTSHR